MNLYLHFLFLCTIQGLVRRRRASVFTRFVLFGFRNDFVVKVTLPVTVHRVRLCAEFLPMCPTRPIMVPIACVSSLFPRGVSIFVYRGRQVLLSVYVRPRQYRGEVSRGVGRAILTSHRGRDYRVAIFVYIRRYVNRFFQEGVSTFCIYVHVRKFVRNLHRPSTHLQVLRSLFGWGLHLFLS